MYKIELSINDEMIEDFMDMLNKFPKDRFKVLSEQRSDEKVSKLEGIDLLLEENNLSHFKFLEDTQRIVYTYQSGTSVHANDYYKLVTLLRDKNIKHNDIGIDVLLIQED